jgi:hypothetical protein
MTLHADPTGGWTSVKENGGGFIPAAFRTGLSPNDASCSVVDTTQFDPVTGDPLRIYYPKYLLSGSNRLEFQTVDISLTMDKQNVMLPDSIEINLNLDAAVPFDSITWHVTNFPKTPSVGAFHPECKNLRVCYIKPAVSGGEHANVKIWGFWGLLELKSDEFYGFSLCASDPSLAVDTLANSAEFRRAIKALMDSSWADSAANKRRERQVYFYRDSSDHSVPPRVQAYWVGQDSIAPLPCMSWFAPNNPGPEYVLVGWAHAHPFAANEQQPSNCGPLHAGYPYQPGPSTWDWASYAQRGGVTAYAVDKWAVNRFRIDANGNPDEGYYPWNSLGCAW